MLQTRSWSLKAILLWCWGLLPTSIWPDTDDAAEAQGSEELDAEFGGLDTMALVLDEWDAGCPWRPWAVHADPVGELEAVVAVRACRCTCCTGVMQQHQAPCAWAIASAEPAQSSYSAFQ